MKWSDFVARYPNHSPYRFSNVNGNVRFIFNGDELEPFNLDNSLKQELYHFPGDSWAPENIHTFLKDKEMSFPQKYKLNKSANYKILPWDSYPQKLNYHSFDVFITPSQKTNFTFRNIFNDSRLILKESEVKKWNEKPDLSFWAQQLNFAVWCATGGCGVSREMLTDTQVDSFYKFHVYFTIRRILNELQCPLPKDKHFSRYNNYFNKNSFEKLKTEFKTPNSHQRLGTTIK